MTPDNPPTVPCAAPGHNHPMRLDDPWMRLELPDGELFFRELECLAEWVQSRMMGEGGSDGARID